MFDTQSSDLLLCSWCYKKTEILLAKTKMAALSHMISMADNRQDNRLDYSKNIW